MYSTPRVLQLSPTMDLSGSSRHSVLITAMESAPTFPNMRQSVTAFRPTPRMPSARVSRRASA